jgi:hypothetical protein
LIKTNCASRRRQRHQRIILQISKTADSEAAFLLEVDLADAIGHGLEADYLGDVTFVVTVVAAAGVGAAVRGAAVVEEGEDCGVGEDGGRTAEETDVVVGGGGLVERVGWGAGG